LVENKNFH